jgi:putative ABC transport system permease protein
VWRVLMKRLRFLLRPGRVEHDIEREVAFHLDMEARERAQTGMDAEQARRSARVDFGNIATCKEDVRDAAGLRLLLALKRDLLYAFRAMRREPGFTLIAMLTLALGIGATTSIFSVIDGVLLRHTPVADVDRVMMLWETDRNSNTTREPASVPDYLDFEARVRNFDTTAAISGTEANLNPASGDPIRVAGMAVTRGFMPMLGIKPLVGRDFNEAEDRAGGTRAVMISEALWERSFGRDPNVIGQMLRLNELPIPIVGVVPQAADFGVLQLLSAADYSRAFADRGDRTRVDVWLPLQPNPKTLPRDTHPIFVMGRLKAGATPAGAQSEMSAIMSDLEHAYPAANDGRGAFVEPLSDVVFGEVRPALYVLLGAVGLVLLVACVNVANLLLARGASRVQEVVVRTALGARSSQLARQFMIETMMLALIGSAAGVFMAFAGLRVLLALAPADIPRLTDVAIDLRVLGATAGLSLLIGLVFGVVPTFQAKRIASKSGIQTTGSLRTTASREQTRLRSALIVAEFSLAVLLMIGAGLLIRSFWQLEQVDPGFRTSGILKAEYQLPPSRYPANLANWPNLKEIQAFTDTLMQRASALPGIEAAAIAANHPMNHGFATSFTVVGREEQARNWPEISVRQVTPGYFQTVGLQLRRGRLLSDSDRAGTQPVAVVNEAVTQRFFDGHDPIGARINFWGSPRTIVGVVANEKFQGLNNASPIAVYLTMAQAPSNAGALIIRTSGDSMAHTGAVRQVFRELDPQLAVFGIEPLADTVSRSISRQRFMMSLLAVFAGVALLLAAIGIYGILSYTVQRRTHEIGIRMALGALPGSMVKVVVGEGLRLVLAGLAVGFVGAFGVTRLMDTLLFGVTPMDPLTFIGVGVVLAIVALVASYVPTRRVTRIPPTIALRTE